MDRATPNHEVLGVRHEPGELSFEARIGDRRERIWMRVDEKGPTSAEAVLPACLMPAMRFGGTLELPVPISPRLLRNQREYQGIQRAWSLEWPFGDPPLREVEVRAPAEQAGQAPGNRRVAAFFSGGVDSWSTVLDHPEITDLVFVRGVDLLPSFPQHTGLVDLVEERLRGVADDLGLDLHVVETNLRDLTDPLARWEVYCGAALATVALFLAPRFERILMAKEADYEVEVAFGVSRSVNNLWSTEGLEIAEDGGRFSRFERTARIASHPLVQRSLRVCWENPEGAYNCGRCTKCLCTMVALEVEGRLGSIKTFPSELDHDAIAETRISTPLQVSFWEDLLDAVRSAGRADLEPAVEPVLEDGKRRLGFPPAYRRRAQPGPLPLNPVKAEAARKAQEREAALGNPGMRRLAAEVLESRSWKLTAPLRRARRLLSR